MWEFVAIFVSALHPQSRVCGYAGGMRRVTGIRAGHGHFRKTFISVSVLDS